MPARDAQKFAVKVQRDDIVILASDGLVDNVFSDDLLEEVLRFVGSNANTSSSSPASAPASTGNGTSAPRYTLRRFSPQAVSEALCFRAKSVYEDQRAVASPFQQRAMEEGIHFAGGKPDDVSCLVGVVGELEAAPVSPSLGPRSASLHLPCPCSCGLLTDYSYCRTAATFSEPDRPAPSPRPPPIDVPSMRLASFRSSLSLVVWPISPPSFLRHPCSLLSMLCVVQRAGLGHRVHSEVGERIREGDERRAALTRRDGEARAWPGGSLRGRPSRCAKCPRERSGAASARGKYRGDAFGTPPVPDQKGACDASSPFLPSFPSLLPHKYTMAPSLDQFSASVSNVLPSLNSNGHAAPTKVPHKPTSHHVFKGAAVQSSNLDVVRELLSVPVDDTLELGGYSLSPADVVVVARKGRKVAVKDDEAIRNRIDKSVEFLRSQLNNSVYGVTTVRSERRNPDGALSRSPVHCAS